MCHREVELRTRGLAREQRQIPTRSEEALWRDLRARRMDGSKFRRQTPLGPYVVDFVCFEARLVVELDGPPHDGVAARKTMRDAMPGCARKASGSCAFRTTSSSEAPARSFFKRSAMPSGTPHPTFADAKATFSREGRRLPALHVSHVTEFSRDVGHGWPNRPGVTPWP